ncbi:unnamed protein product [Rhodiola kirilowii]
MVDASHLEKMGSELKCPVCLSLLEYAASITCNHVFCNSCIVKSMKKESSCPVCKMPFHRREIRPAPHMDNLVGIYKSMETASGVNIFMSESAPASQLPEKLDEACIHVQNDSQLSSGNHVRSSFSRKKRVQVAQYPLPETPVHSAKVGTRIPESMPEEHKIEMASLKSDHNQSDKHGTCRSPFFWLRDDEYAENLSQQSNGTAGTESTPPAAPAFSDIMDSEDESPSEENTQGNLFGKSPAVDLSDNDMLEWTQSPFSREQYSKPTKLQIKVVQEEQHEVASQVRNTYESHPSKDADHLILGHETSLTTLHHLDSAVNQQIPKTQNISKRKKNTTKARTTSKKTTISLGTPLDVDGTPKNQDPVEKRNCNFLNLQEKTEKIRKRPTKFETTAELGLESNPSEPTKGSCNPTDKVADVELPNQLEKGNKCIWSKTSKITSGIKSKSILDSCSRSMKRQCEPSNILEFRNLSENDNIERIVEASPVCAVDNCSKIRKQKSMLLNGLSEAEKKGRHMEIPLVRTAKSCLRSRSQKLRPMKTVSSNKFAEHENREDNHDHHEALHEDSCLRSSSQDPSTRAPLKDLYPVKDSPAILPVTVSDNVLVSGEKTVKYGSETSKSKETVSSNDSPVGISGNASITHGVLSNNIQTTTHVLGNSGEVINNSALQAKRQSLVQQTPLCECESNLRKIQCAFCQSAEDSKSKPYGKMIHYFDGKPVSTDHKEGSDLIHCHQICAEWAPNVYFKDDIAINLKAEFLRSRRISCSCCGVKGAALGCYHKSCHRSFHVPCAKLMPECRWDAENYVMLCPLHASSKLPCEMSRSQRKRKRVSENNSMQECITATDIPKSEWKGDSHRSSEKIVLCCSALAAFDKDIVYQFKMLTGVRESKTWSSSVTHVIASVDENDACRRTLKILMGIMEGKWILSVKWLKACIDAKRLVDEQQYEITADIHGAKDGPRLGRLRVLNKEPKLFHGLEFYFCGEFAASYKGYLQDLITTAGGTVLHRKPIVADQSRPSTFIIYNLELPDNFDPSKRDTLLNKRINIANALANSTGAKASSNAWILNCIASCQLQNTDE